MKIDRDKSLLTTLLVVPTAIGIGILHAKYSLQPLIVWATLFGGIDSFMLWFLWSDVG